ncbi:hypothetical protein KDJ56_04800 [Brevibacillus composti]|uniref:Uncharacterized protein n=1 Tax=Brevibacillus composti TaxID=2796470 RepID=A0A7T5EMJ4_9BACL|nr:hypothetical protein [Brevibacillus composti]QQE75308.1 hypothetical protein JD108_05120 [Brevibacillus composti]QUO42335.1 hypothetical protein KDJ56_04800 [Brevibacillus composti]
MKRWSQSLFAAVLALGLSLPTGVLATEAEPEVPVSEAKSHHEQMGHHKGYAYHCKSVHKRMYLTLLAEKYTPESAEEWKAALDERKRLKEAFKAQKDKMKADPAKKKEAKESMRAFKEKYKENHREFHAAIESGDEAKIKAVLPKLLAEVKETNAYLARKLGEKR